MYHSTAWKERVGSPADAKLLCPHLLSQTRNFKRMMIRILGLMTLFHFVDSQTIQQIPAAVSKIPGENVTLKCTVQGISNTWMYWYRLSPGKEPQYMFHSAGRSIVTPGEPVDGFKADRPSNTEFNLKSPTLLVNHSAVYFCAWSLHSESERGCSSTKTPNSSWKQRCFLSPQTFDIKRSVPMKVDNAIE
ncbi:hypothetical protein chiPu_0012171 [Chiloscyllium punctatum]|uniref:Ig-like domain-containing protein n=1 Tax=Chiloscyllium punctatum TaxID=137246 RepID=A0A401STI5_CHIPU|nr:hypothetical protein [Chiloscyllium punctatum]